MATKYLDYAGLQTLLNKLFAREFKGMGLSTNDFTNALKTKLESLASPSDLAALATKVSQLEGMIAADSDGVINKFNEIVSFLAGIGDDKTLDGMLSDISTQIANAKKAGTDAQSELTTFKASVYTKTQADSNFVAKVSGKDLSSNDYTTAEKNAVATISNKVDKVEGKGLSTNDYTTAEKTAVATIDNKVDKVTGKGLSTNDYTTTDKNLVATISSKVDKVTGKDLSSNDYTTADKTLVGTISNKVDKVAGKGLSTNDYTDAEKTAVATIGSKVDKESGKGLSTNDYTTADKNAVATIGNKLNASDIAAISTTEITSLLTAAGV